MATESDLRGERVVLRRWQPEDRAPFAALNADPEVMAHFPATLSREQSDAFVERIEAHFERTGYGLWALELPEVVPFAGFVGLLMQTFDAPFTPAIEIGWRVDARWWHRGYATEAARLVLRFGFTSLELPEIVSMTTTTNVASQAVMIRLGMHHDADDDFDHPSVPPGPLRRHVLFRITRDEWQAAESGQS